MFKDIRHIILDLGGVLLNIDYTLTENAFTRLGVPDFAIQYSQLQQSRFFDDFECGRSNSELFISGLKNHCTKEVSDSDIRNAWNAMLLDLPLRRLQILQQLQLHFDTFLLSNTNEIHEERFNEILKAQTGFGGFGVFFDKVYYSHRIGMRKPDTEVFRLILDNHGLNAEKTLFVDDSPQHIEGAKKLGIQTIWLERGMTIEDDIFKPKTN